MFQTNDLSASRGKQSSGKPSEERVVSSRSTKSACFLDVSSSTSSSRGKTRRVSVSASSRERRDVERRRLGRLRERKGSRPFIWRLVRLRLAAPTCTLAQHTNVVMSSVREATGRCVGHKNALMSRGTVGEIVFWAQIGADSDGFVQKGRFVGRATQKGSARCSLPHRRRRVVVFASCALSRVRRAVCLRECLLLCLANALLVCRALSLRFAFSVAVYASL